MVATIKVLRYVGYNGTDKPISRAKAHVKYIEADREKHRNNPVLFNGKEDRINRKDFFKRLEEQQPNGVVIHKMVLTMSEDEQKRLNIDMRELARDTMDSFETKIGRRLDWAAALHDDEGHPHVHIVIRGRDENGRQVGIYPVQVKMLKQIAEREKTRQVERNFPKNKARDILKEFDKEREGSSRQTEYQRSQPQPIPSSGVDFSKDALNAVERLLKQSQKEMERAQRKAWRRAAREVEQEKKGREAYSR